MSGVGNVERLDWLDTLRGIAALSVFAEHLIWSWLAPYLNAWIDPGVFGVSLFFWISGYIVPLSAERSGSANVQKFLLSRFFRLYPAYWVSLAAAVLLARSATPASVFANITMLQRFLGQPDMIPVYWTLQVEILFYAAVVAMLALGHLHKLRSNLWIALFFSFVAALGGVFRLMLGVKVPIAPLLGLSLMFIANSARLIKLRSGLPFRMSAMLAVCGILVFVAVATGYSRNWGYNEVPSRFIITNGLAAIIFLLVMHYRASWGPLRFSGRISYSLYLLNLPVVAVILIVIPAAGSVVRLLTEICGVLCVAMIMYFAVERPGIGLGKKVMAWLVRSPAAS
jgi:peptidoglycan/LPS O-acetylase OafA/YrhL